MRKWNKLLALVLAMVMVFGLTATAFAEGEDKDDTKTPTESTDTDKTEGEKKDETTPAEGEEKKDDAADPAEGEEKKDDAADPAEDEEKKDDATEINLEGVDEWAKENVATVVKMGLIDTTETGFNATAPMTRGDLVLALYRLAEKPAVAEDAANPFTDLGDMSDEAKAAVVWAYSQKIVNGETETTFNPNGAIERQGIAKVLFVYAGDKAKAVEEDKLAAFSDKDSVAEWAVDYLNWLVSTGLMNGSDGKLLPTGNVERQGVAALLCRYMDNILNAEPAEGEDAKEPAEGEDAKEPAEGEDAKEPAEGETKEPAEGETKEPAEGDAKEPTEGETKEPDKKAE